MITRVDIHKALGAANFIPMEGEFYRDNFYSCAEDAMDCGYILQECIVFARRLHAQQARGDRRQTGLAIGEFWYRSERHTPTGHGIALWAVRVAGHLSFVNYDPGPAKPIGLTDTEVATLRLTLF